HEGKAEWGREVERLKLIHRPDFDDLIYDFRTMAERVNARLKDEFGARFLRVRGALKVKSHLMFGIVALAIRSSLDERGGGGVGRGLWRDRGCGASDEGRAKHDRTRSEGSAGSGLADRTSATQGRRQSSVDDERPTLLEDLQRLLDPATMSDPMRPLRWVSKSHDKLVTALRGMGDKVSSSTIPKLLAELKYCRHFNRKTKEGSNHPDRDAQFEYIQRQGRSVSGRRSTRDLGRHQEEGIARRIQEWRERLRAPGQADRGQHPRFREQGPGQGRPLRGLPTSALIRAMSVWESTMI